MAKKVTFTLDEDTVARLGQMAKRLHRPKSQVVREAIADYSARVGRLSELERLRQLKAFDRLVPAIPERSVAEVEEELQALRRDRRGSGRLSSGHSE